MIYPLFRRGVGIFRLLFTIDDFFRLITLSILLPLLARWLGLPTFLVFFFLAIGLAMDLYDYFKEIGPGMSLSLKDLNPLRIFRKEGGIAAFAFAIHDLIQIGAMTILIPIFLNWIGLRQPFISMGVVLGIMIDIHDFVTEFSSGKVEIEK